MRSAGVVTAEFVMSVMGVLHRIFHGLVTSPLQVSMNSDDYLPRLGGSICIIHLASVALARLGYA